MITIINFLTTAILTFLTASLFPHFRFFDVVPLLPLFFVIQLAYYRKGFEPLLLAAMAGIYLDLVSPDPFGFYLMLFLITAGVVRYFFEEGLRSFSFWHYLIISGGALTAYLLGQLIFVGFGGLSLSWATIAPLLAFGLVNLTFAAVLYFAGLWYFEQLIVLENYLKRR